MTDPLKPNVTELAWWITTSVPFDWHWSKNRIWQAVAGSYARRLMPHARGRRDMLAQSVRSEMIATGGIVAIHNRLWLSLHVEIPDHTGDAINCLDLAADAVHIATDLDDRWTQLAGLTWTVVKENPRLWVSIGQEAGLVDSQVCGSCGLILPFASFTKGGNKRRLAGQCRPCAKVKRVIAKESRAAPVPEVEPRKGDGAPW